MSKDLVGPSKEKMWKYLTANSMLRYVDILQKLVKSYNHSRHRSIGMTPVDVNKKNKNVVWQNLYGNESSKLVRFKFNRVVRILAVKFWLQIQVTQHKSFIIFVAYRPPDSEVTCIREELKPICIEALLKGKQVVAMGDLNCNQAVWKPKY